MDLSEIIDTVKASEKLPDFTSCPKVSFGTFKIDFVRIGPFDNEVYLKYGAGEKNEEVLCRDDLNEGSTCNESFIYVDLKSGWLFGSRYATGKIAFEQELSGHRIAENSEESKEPEWSSPKKRRENLFSKDLSVMFNNPNTKD